MRMAFALSLMLGMNLPALAGNGDLDVSFGTGGFVRTGLSNAAFPYGGFVSIPPVMQPDGKILICSSQSTGSASGTDFFVSRFTANGVLDTSFSFDGKVTIDFDGGGGADLCTGVALQADGKIVVVGYTFISAAANGADFAIARLNTDGTLDTGFGGGTGKTTVGFDLGNNNDDAANSVAIQPDGKIVVAGYATTAANGTDFAVVRLNTDGSRDSSFNLTGKVSVGFNLTSGTILNNDVATSVAIDALGNVVLGGYANKGSTTSLDDDFAVVRLLPNGVLDSNFDADGRATLAFDLGGATGSNLERAYAMTLQRDGKIVLGGVTDSSSSSTANYDMAIARLQPDGSPDSNFGIDGKTLVSFDVVANGEDFVLGLTEQSNGKILLAGAAQTAASDLDAAVVRLNGDGSPDAEFGALGKVRLNLALASPNTQVLNGVALQGTQIIANGFAPVGGTSSFDNFVVRLKNDLIFASGFE